MTATAVLPPMQQPQTNFQPHRERVIPITVIHDDSRHEPRPGKFAGVQDTLRLKPKNRSSLPFNDIPHGGSFPMPSMDDFMKNFNLLGNGNYITANSPILAAQGGSKPNFFDIIVRPKQPGQGQSSPQRSASQAPRPSVPPQGFQQTPQPSPVRPQQFQSPQRQSQVPVLHVTPPGPRPQSHQQAPQYSITSTSRPVTPDPEPHRETLRPSSGPSSFTVHLGGSQPQQQMSGGYSSLPRQEAYSPGPSSSLARQRTHSPVPSSRQQQNVYPPGSSSSLSQQRTHSPVPSSSQQQNVYSPGSSSSLPQQRTHSPVPSSRQQQNVYSPGSSSSLPQQRTHSPVPSSRPQQEMFSPGPSGRSPPHSHDVRSFPARPTISSPQSPSSNFQPNSSPTSSHVQRLTVGMSQPIPVVSEHKLEATPHPPVSYHSPRPVTPEMQTSSATIIPDINQNQHSYDNMDSRFSPDVPDSWVQQHRDSSSSSPVRSTGSPQVARAYWDPAVRVSPPREEEKLTGILKNPRSSPKSRNRGVSFGTVTVFYI